MHRPAFFFMLILGLRVGGGALAQAPDWLVQGYVKDLAGWMPSARDQNLGAVQDILQVRTQVTYFGAPWWSLAVSGRNRLVVQRGLTNNPAWRRYLDSRNGYVDLSVVPVHSTGAVWHAEIDRAWTRVTRAQWQITAGRQRIAWGTNLVWNPTDVFNAYDILDFDYEEKPGADALRLEAYTGPVSKIEVAGKVDRDRFKDVAAVSCRTHVAEYDVAVLGGYYQKGYFVGANWAGQIHGGGFRGEVRLTNPGLQEVTAKDGLPASGYSEILGRPYGTVAVSGDYTFANSLYVHSEALYNGLGARRHAGSRQGLLTETGELSASRWSWFQEFSYQITPLLRGGIFAIVDPLDASYVLVPSATYSVATNWELYLIVLAGRGRSQSEFGALDTRGFARLKWSF